MDIDTCTVLVMTVSLVVSMLNVWLTALVFQNQGGRHNHILRPLVKRIGLIRALTFQLVACYVVNLAPVLLPIDDSIAQAILTGVALVSFWNAKRNFDSYRRLRNMLESQDV